MAAAILTLVLTTVVSGATWLSLGNLFRLHRDDRQNDVLNLATYAVAMLPIIFAVVFFAMERFDRRPADQLLLTAICGPARSPARQRWSPPGSSRCRRSGP